MPAQTATCTPRDTQADSRTGAAGHTHTGTREKAGVCCTGELRGVGHTHGRRTHARTHAQGHTEMLSHTGARRRLCHPHKKKSLSHACMNTGQLHAATRYKRPCHSQAHTCSQEPSHTGIIACRNRRCHSVNAKRGYTSTHEYTMQQQVFSWTPTVDNKTPAPNKIKFVCVKGLSCLMVQGDCIRDNVLGLYRLSAHRPR